MTGDRPLGRRLDVAYLRWACVRAVLSRGYWLVASVYLVTVAHQRPAHLVLIGTFQALVVTVAEVPCGVLADTVSRRLSLVVGHVVMGGGMALAGCVTSFRLLVVSQCLWGLGWAFSSGADVAWVTDELGAPAQIDSVLLAQARWDLIGTALGIVSFGALAWATTLAAAIVVSGVSMGVLGIAVVGRWPEDGFAPTDAGGRWRTSSLILRGGIRLARADRVVAAVLAGTLLVNGGLTFGRLREARLVAIGMPARPDPVVWFAALGLVGAALGATVVRVVEQRAGAGGTPRRTYLAMTVVGAAGLVVFAAAPDLASVVAGLLLISGIAEPVLRAAGVIWLNQQAPSAVRATVHSMLSQAENLGEFVFGTVLAIVAGATTTGAILAGAVLILAAGGVVAGTTSRRIAGGGTGPSLPARRHRPLR